MLFLIYLQQHQSSLKSISERVADIKTHAQSMKCLTTFCEAVGPRFIFERLTMIMKEHKNPKVLSEGLLWMITAIEDFGVSHLKLKDVIDFCKDVGLHSNAATRNATIKLIGVLHKFVGPDIKGFLSDLKPALLSALDAAYEKNPFEGTSSIPKRTVKASDSVCVSGGGLDSLPREDISGKITPALLKGLESSDWKIRLESIEGVNKILEEANKRIQPTGAGELFGALRCRLYDSNKNIIMSTLSTVGAVASSMGPAVEKSCKGILSNILKCLGDNKKHMRECALNTLDAWVAAIHLEKMVPYITASLTDAKICADGRKDLFDWSSKQLKAMKEFPEALFFLKPAASAMMGNSLAIVIERLRPDGGLQGSVELGKTITTVLSTKNNPMLGKSNAATPHFEDRKVFRVKSSRQESLMSSQGIGIQSQALINTPY